MGRATSFGQIGESDFQNLLQALSATAKGRAFLAEYGRRSRPDETSALLAALERIERNVASVRDQLQPERIAGELRRVAITLEIATAGMDAGQNCRELSRRIELVVRARDEIAALAVGLAGRAVQPDGPPPQLRRGETGQAATVVAPDDDHAFLEQLYAGAVPLAER